MMAGPCSVESRDQLFETADAVAAAGATVLRGGAFKPRTSPYAFQGLGVEALRYLAEARERTGLPVITEVMEPNQVDIVAEYADILQIGTRNMQNYSLLRDVGRVARPVMLKRGYGATVEEWLMAAEYIVSSGNPNVILCERGIRTFETYTRNTLDLAAVPLLHRLTHLPVIVDPSHATGKRWLVRPLAIGGVAVGADGVMVEVHPNPDEALSDAEQQLDIEGFRDLMAAIVPVHEHVRGLHADRSVGRCVAGRRRRRAGQALSASTVSGAGTGAARRPHGRPPARRAAPARRQVGQPSRPAAGRAWPRARAGSRRPGDGADVRSTAGIVRALGATVERVREDGRTVDYRVVSPGADGLRQPAATLDCGNSGTSLRLTSGILAGLPMTATLDGDDSLRGRPVARIIEPLRSMGALLRARQNDSLPPLTVTGRTPLAAIDYTTPVPSAQVKSAVLLAGLRADGRTTVRESIATRDHTERMLRARGVPVERGSGPDRAVTWTVQGGMALQAVDERVPGDVSAAAFWLVAGSIHPDAELTLRDVGVNPTRRAVIDLLRRMGADIDEHLVASREPPRPTTSASRSPTWSCARPSCMARTSTPPTWPRPSTRSPSCAWPRRWPTDRRRSAAPASCDTRNPTGSPGSRRACKPSARASRSSATTCASRAMPACAGPRPTASTTTASP